MNCTQLIETLRSGGGDVVLRALYAPAGEADALSAARERAVSLAERHRELFSAWYGPEGAENCALFSAPGRTELGGNHTDHQGGRVLCAAVDLDLLACAAPNGLGRVRLVSEGFGQLEVELSELWPWPPEEGTPEALIRGVAAGFAANERIPAGFDAVVDAAVPVGSGLSSSAAFELLIASIFNAFCGGEALQPAELARIGQRAENVWFGKPCGLMDQLASALGGTVAIDFRDPAQLRVDTVSADFAAAGFRLLLVDTGSDHADLTEDYAAIPREMGEVAEALGVKLLSQAPEEKFRAMIPVLRYRCGDRAVLRALHYYAEDRRAAEKAEALRRGDTAGFLRLARESGLSSQLLLQNAFSTVWPEHQSIPLALALGRELLGERGAIRVHGGGFAGTVLAFVPERQAAEFTAVMETAFSPGCCRELRIRPHGAGRLNIG